MLLKFITKFIRSLGLFFIFFFAVFCIFGSLFMRDIDPSTLTAKFLEYTISFESRFYDYRMRDQIDPKKKSKDIALVKIDDYSLERIGMWPIPRAIHAEMIDKLKTFGAKVVALDVLYPEKPRFVAPAPPIQFWHRRLKTFNQKVTECSWPIRPELLKKTRYWKLR